MLKKTAKKNAFNNKLMSLALATGITAQAVPFTTNLLPSITQNVLAHADDNQSETFSYTLQTKDENGKVVASDKITFTQNDDGTYKVTDEAGLLKNNTSNVKIDDMMNIQLNNLIDSTKELNWISQNGQYKLADNHESATPDDQGNLTFAVVKNTTNKDNGGNSDSTAPTTPTDNKDHNQSGSDSSNTTPAKPTDNNQDNQSGSDKSDTTPAKPTDSNKDNQSDSKDNQEQPVVYHLNLVNDGKTVKNDTITFAPKGDGSYTVKDDAGLAITSDYTPAKDSQGVLTFDLNSALNSGLINWINDGTWQLDGAQSVQTSGQDVNYKVVKADSNHQGDPATSSTNVVLNLVNSATNKVVKTDTFTFTPTGEDGHYLVTDTAGLAPAIDYVAQKVDGKYNFNINSVVSANILGSWVNDGTWTLDSNKQEGTKGEDGSLNFYVTHAKTDAGYLQSFKEKYPSDKYGIVNQNGSTFTFVQFDPSTKQVTYMGTIDMSQADPQATKLNDGTTSYTRTFTRTIYGLFDGEKRQVTGQSAEMTVTQHTTFVGDNQPLKTNLTYSKAKFDAYKPTVVPNGYKLVKEVDIPEMNIDQNTPSLSSAEQMSEYQSVNTDSGSGSTSNSGTPDSGNPSSDSNSSTPDSGQTSSGSASTPGSGDASSDSGSSSTPTKPDSGSGSSSTPTKPDSGSDSTSTPTTPDSGSGSSSTPTKPDSGSNSSSTPTTPDSGNNSSSTPTTPTKPDSDNGSSSTPTTPSKPDSGSDQSSSASSSTPTNPSSGSSASSTPSSNTSSAAPSSSTSSSVSSGASSSTSSHASSSTSSSTSSKASSNTNSNTSSHASSATNSKASSNTSSHATSGASSKANSNASSASANSSAPNSQNTTLPSEAAAKFNSMPTATSSNGTINPLAQTNARNNGNQALALSMLGGSLVISGLGLGLLNKRKEE